MALFQSSVLNNYLKLQDQVDIEKAYKKYTKYFHNIIVQKNIRKSKEEQFQEGFLRELFVNVFGYTLNPNANFNLTTELKNEKGTKKVDGAILKDGKALGVIELKGTNTKNLEKVRQQAFDYKANQTGCVYVITSNFEKIRFYINDAVEFEEFELFNINEERFKLLYLCLAQDNLLNNIPLKIKEDSLQEEENITKQFYADYSCFKRELFRDLVRQNMKNEVFHVELNKEDSVRASKNIKLNLFKKSQKLIDRFLFIFFAEDRGLLPPNTTLKILENWSKLNELDAAVPLYDRFKLNFNYLDKGRKGTAKVAEIFAYNGGLFKSDSVLDSLVISDSLLLKHSKQLSRYDFDSQVDVNILGHIFENSLNEIESISSEIEGTNFKKQKSKRKKDGVFYTPKYITKYIVENTIGRLCNEKKNELKITEEEFRPKRQKETQKRLLASLERYREWLLQITILDPACGSGAFLNQALDYLIREHQYLDELQTALFGGGFVFPNIENTVLENNIFGVDLNEESIEIAKLSLWLRTAQPRRKLNDLSNNIKCGNSLVESKTVAGDKAFNWQNEFPEVFSKGGFDVVIGNPPYVRADSPGNLLPFREYLVTSGKYKTLKGKWDLYIPFIEMSIQVLSPKGLASLIIPDAYCHANYSTQSLKYFMDNSMLERIDYYPDIEVFANVGVKSVIVSLNRNKTNSNFTSRTHYEDLTYSEIQLGKYPKNFRLDSSPSFIKDVADGVSLDKIMYISVGIVGNSDEKKYKGEFKVGDLLSDIKSDTHTKLYYEGKNINRWMLGNERWIEYGTERSPTKWRRKAFPEFFRAKKIVGMRSPGKSPRIFIDKSQGIFNESAIGFVRWADLKGIENKSISSGLENNDERLIREQISSAFEIQYLLGIMNSKLIKYELNANRRSNIHIYPDDWRKIKIVSAPLEVQKALVQNVEAIIGNTSNQEIIKSDFIKYLQATIQLDSLSNNLQNWYKLDFGKFIIELNKAIKKVGGEKLSKTDEMDWMKVFESKKEQAQTLKYQIDKIDNEINRIVYELYDLTEKEIKIVEQA